MSLSVVVGAGGTGVATAELLAESGHDVRLVTRRGSGPEHPRIELIKADANDTPRLVELTKGASILFNCAVPAYHRWATEFMPLARSLLNAAERTGVGYVMLGNLYAYGPVDGPMFEDRPLVPNTVKGRVRRQAWDEAIAAHRAGRVRVTEVRASDFIGTGAMSVFTIMVAPKVLAGKAALFPADLDAPHTWTDTQDAARALVAAGENDQAWGRAWHVPSNPPLSSRQLAVALAEHTGAPPAKLRRMPGSMLRLAGLFSPTVGEIPEMQYQLQRPFVMDSSLTQDVLGLKPSLLEEILDRTAAAV
ncbi:NAD-dependent epimerase/dehydratase [Parafrankia sp. EAN1pec]|uniref:NAD-dependent epimerase/dehydratase family protein n=1 Tax=Parafrankia sp. (strain EAN1pec) TaxID=298653 RepID=UPI00005446A3|nr:NAD-dependent epimerase/dehydratase [Frankia sp. EAN1pec]